MEKRLGGDEERRRGGKQESMGREYEKIGV